MNYTTNPREAWNKWLADAAGTRQQITYATVGSFLFVVLYGLRFAKSVQDIAVLAGAMQFVVLSVMVFWFGGKWLEAKGAGGAITQNPDIPSEDPIARLERLEG